MDGALITFCFIGGEDIGGFLITFCFIGGDLIGGILITFCFIASAARTFLIAFLARLFAMAFGIDRIEVARRSVGRVQFTRDPANVKPASACETKGCELLTYRHKVFGSCTTFTDTKA